MNTPMDRIPVEPFSPGEYIQECMDSLAWSQEDLADVLGRSRQHVNRLLRAQTSITPETAIELGKAFGTSAKLWLNLQVSYDLARADGESRGIEERSRLYKKLPIRDMQRRGWIKATKNSAELHESVCRFLRVSDLNNSPGAAVAARKSTTYEMESPAQIAWYTRARELAECSNAARYRRSDFDAMIGQLKECVAHLDGVTRVPPILADHGIRFVIVETIPRAKIDGAAFWIGASAPAVALSLRYDRLDYFWHTLFHELVHIKYEDAKESVNVDVDFDNECPSDVELRANREAANYLIATEDLNSFIARQQPLFYKTKIIQFAQALKVHPAIVVGQLQYRKVIDFAHSRALLAKIRNSLIGAALTDGWGNHPRIGRRGD